MIFLFVRGRGGTGRGGEGLGGVGRARAELYSCGADAGSAFSARAVSLKMCTLFVPVSWGITL